MGVFRENLRLRERIEVLEKQQTISKKPSFTNEKILSRFLPRAINSEDLPPSPSEHQFLIETFHSPLVCHQCENALLGLVRQGFICRRK